jgi:signal transduction histidine kinase
MRERIRKIGGALAVESAPGRGTSIKIKIPLE